MIYKNKILWIGFLIFITSCSIDKKIDRLYQQQKYEDAYILLKNYGKPNTPKCQERELKILFYLSVEKPEQYLSILDNTLLIFESVSDSEWYNLARSWRNFLSASEDQEYKEVLEIIPKTSFREEKAELIRLIIISASLSKLERFQEVIAYLSVSKLIAKNSDLLYLQGFAYYKLNQNKKAKKSLEQAIEIGENDKLISLSYFRLGTIYYKENNILQAQTYFQKAWDKNPFLAELNFQIGKVFQQQTYKELHFKFYRASLRLNENLAEAWYYLNL